MLDIEQERDAICSWQDKRDTAALELLVRSHARQAWSHAAKFTDNPVHLEDLASEGMIGLMRAADNFDRKQDVRFSTYAGWWVMNGISSALSRIKAVIDIPSRTYLDAQLGKLTEDERQLVLQAVQGLVVIDGSLADDDTGRRDILISEELGPEDIVSERDRHEMLSQLLLDALKPLSHEECEVIRRRKLAAEPEPFCAIARDLGVSEGRLRQVERRAMMRLRRNLVERGFSRSVLS
ncbi:MAG: sigma-70 family RNA polymerase sigma factor [Pseudooceanicola sp.]